MNKHTPGPWSVTSEPDEEYPVWDVGHRTVGGPLDGDVLHVCDTVDEADARLIAAAPEMLEALKWAHDFAYDAYDDTKHYDKTVAEWLVRCEAAIAKAEGRSDHEHSWNDDGRCDVCDVRRERDRR